MGELTIKVVCFIQPTVRVTAGVDLPQGTDREISSLIPWDAGVEAERCECFARNQRVASQVKNRQIDFVLIVRNFILGSSQTGVFSSIAMRAISRLILRTQVFGLWFVSFMGFVAVHVTLHTQRGLTGARRRKPRAHEGQAKTLKKKDYSGEWLLSFSGAAGDLSFFWSTIKSTVYERSPSVITHIRIFFSPTMTWYCDRMASPHSMA
jgi:hypothetical protein